MCIELFLLVSVTFKTQLNIEIVIFTKLFDFISDSGCCCKQKRSRCDVYCRKTHASSGRITLTSVYSSVKLSSHKYGFFSIIKSQKCVL